MFSRISALVFFAGTITATVLAVYSATEWVEVRGASAAAATGAGLLWVLDRKLSAKN